MITKTPPPRTRRPGPALTLLGLAVLGMLSLGAAPADDIGVAVDDARAALQKWVETRRIISKERRDWVLARETLHDRIDLVQREIDGLRTSIDDAESSLADADAKRTALVEENEALKTASSSLVDTVAGLEARTLELLARAPEPIRERVAPLSQRLPEDPAATKLSLAERFQNVLGILNEVNKFNREITVTSEVHVLPDGTSAEVTALYVGLGHGWYVGANGTVAGIGTATDAGWTWRPANELAPRVTQAIRILQNEDVAAFVPLPVEVDR